MKKHFKILFLIISLALICSCQKQKNDVSTLSSSVNITNIVEESKDEVLEERAKIQEQKLAILEQVKIKEEREEERIKLEKQKAEDEKVRLENEKKEEERKEQERIKAEKERKQAEAIRLAANTNSDGNSPQEKFVNNNGYDSESPYLMWVSKSQQKVYVFVGSVSNWRLARAMACSTGAGGTPTPNGTFTIDGRGSWFLNENQVGAKYWTRFYGNYLFHSVIMDKNGNIIDGRVGLPLSHGCVRLAIENAKWVNEIMPDGTRVVIN